MMSAYTPKDVYSFVANDNSASLTVALTISSNRSNWFTNDNGWNALHLATLYGHINCISVLLNNDIDVNSKTNNDTTSLSFAALNRRIQCMELY